MDVESIDNKQVRLFKVCLVVKRKLALAGLWLSSATHAKSYYPSSPIPLLKTPRSPESSGPPLSGHGADLVVCDEQEWPTALSSPAPT